MDTPVIDFHAHAGRWGRVRMDDGPARFLSIMDAAGIDRACINCVFLGDARRGNDMAANLGYFEAFALAHPDVREVLDSHGLLDHPAIVEVGAIMGRRYATTPGDPGEMMTSKGATAMESTMTDVQAKIDALDDAIDAAQARNDTTKAQLLYENQARLYQQLPGGREPIVGGAGRTA